MMKNKESFGVRAIKWFYGVPGIGDEHFVSELNRVGNNAFIVLALYSFFSSIGSFFLALGGSRQTVLIWLAANGVAITWGILLYIEFGVDHHHLLDAEYPIGQAARMAKWEMIQFIKAWIFYFPSAYLAYFIINYGMGHEALSVFLYDPANPILAAIWSLVLGLLTVGPRVMRIKYHKSN